MNGMLAKCGSTGGDHGLKPHRMAQWGIPSEQGGLQRAGLMLQPVTVPCAGQLMLGCMASTALCALLRWHCSHKTAQR